MPPRFKLGPLEWAVIVVAVVLGLLKSWAMLHIIFKYW